MTNPINFRLSGQIPNEFVEDLLRRVREFEQQAPDRIHLRLDVGPVPESTEEWTRRMQEMGLTVWSDIRY